MRGFTEIPGDTSRYFVNLRYPVALVFKRVLLQFNRKIFFSVVINKVGVSFTDLISSGTQLERPDPY